MDSNHWYGNPYLGCLAVDDFRPETHADRALGLNRPPDSRQTKEILVFEQK